MASKDSGSVAPKERVNIVYKSGTGDKQSDTELPLKMLMVGDYTGKPAEGTVEDQEPINVNKDNFNDVMKGYNLGVNVRVKNTLQEGEGEELDASLKFENMKDFSPDSIVKQVPELNQLLELRKALQALKGPVGNVPAFRKAIQELLKDDATRAQIMQELGVGDDTKK